MYIKTASFAFLIATAFGKDTQPHRISYNSLDVTSSADSRSILIDSLATDGIVSVTGIPGFGKTKRDLMAHLHACMMDQGDNLPKEIFQDGTVRRTIATVTLPGARSGAQQPVAFLASESLSESCENFKEHLDSFRSSVDDATNAFAERLSYEMGSSLPSPLMTTQDGTQDFNDIKDIVASGEHLEHFHSYQKSRNKSGIRAEKETIELHADQGFFISFSPGLLVSHGEDKAPDLSKPLVVSEGFYVENSDGDRLLLQFDANDDLVFMMGDGVNQYINNRLHDSDDSSKQRSRKLRATPHAVSLTAHDDSIARVWYGRMILPPKDAFSPIAGQTYGSVRQLFIDSPQEDIPTSLGCSSPGMKAVFGGSRNLSDDGHNDNPCGGDDELYCWFRCMALADFDMTADTCSSQNLETKCVNPRGQVVPDGKKHGDYYPSCTNSTEEVTPYPEISQQDAFCAAEWDDFLSTDYSYDHMVNLTMDKGDETYLSYSIVDGNKIKGRLAFNNVFGWLALGFADPDGKHNGMNGGKILLAIPGGDYSAVTGLDTQQAPSVASYVIHPTGSAFRHWSDPTTAQSDDTTLDTNDCFTSISFESHQINGQNFTIDGTDDMIWGGNGEDHFVGYHGRGNRARFSIEWSTATVKFFGDEEDEEDKEDNVDETPSTSGDEEDETPSTSGGNTNRIHFVYASMALTSAFYLIF